MEAELTPLDAAPEPRNLRRVKNEAWNGANAVICYGRGGEISTNRHEEVEMTALCLRILQAALVYVNTLMLRDVLAEEEWSGMLGPADRRGLTPLSWQHVRPTARSASTWAHASGSAARARHATACGAAVRSLSQQARVRSPAGPDRVRSAKVRCS